MPVIKKHDCKNDWCHICGKRSDTTADVWYPENAEHATEFEHTYQRGSDIKYVRICNTCSVKISEASNEK